MKETTTINISGIIFHIDEDAFAILKKYFADLKKRFGDSEEGKEIINDIELRIAEILQDKLTEKKQVINTADVEEVINIMGNPEDIDDGTEEEPQKEEPHRNEYRDRRLYRDPDNNVLGGVCAGIGHYFGLDPVLIRVLTIIITIFYGIGFLVYLVMWAFIPKAQTTAEKLEMKGEPVNAENIKRKIRENYEDMKNSDTYKKAREGATRSASALGEVGTFILRAIVIIIGVGMLIGAVVSIVAIANLIFFHAPTVYFNGEAHGVLFPMIEAFFESKLTMVIFFLSSILLGLIPLMIILFLGVKLVFNFKTNNKVIMLSSLGIWLVALAVVITIGISLGSRYTYPTDVEKNHILETNNPKALYIELTEFEPNMENTIDDVYYGIGEDGTSYLYHRPDFDVRKSKSDQFELRIVREARGRNRYDATDVAESIRFNFELNDSILRLDPWYETGLQNIGRVDDLDITLFVPEGKKVFFNEEIYPIVYDIKNVNYVSDYDMMGKMWIMSTDGLTEFKNSPSVK